MTDITPPPQHLDAEHSIRCATLALGCIHREFPNQIQHLLHEETDVATPRTLHPVFYGCFDWHSAVHQHWTLVRILRVGRADRMRSDIVKALTTSFTPAKLLREAEYLSAPDRRTFERPYGLAWLLQLAAELREWDNELARKWSGCLAPLEAAARENLTEWLPKLAHPVRSGTHSQTAFAMCLALDWARSTGDAPLARLIENRALDFHRNDRGWPIAYEPSGEDFLSPGLATADLMRRVLPRSEYAGWLAAFLPSIPTDGSEWLRVASVTDDTDGRLAHLHGLNLSRAWSLASIAAALADDDARVETLRRASRRHAEAGLRAVTGSHYSGTHWLAGFAVYLLTGRGCAAT